MDRLLGTVMFAGTLAACGGDGDGDAGPRVRYVDKQGEAEELPFDKAIERFESEADFIPLLLPKDRIEPLVLAEIRVLPDAPTGRPLPRYLFSFQAADTTSNAGFKIDLNLDDLREAGGADLGSGLDSATIGSPPVTVYYRTKANTPPDLYTFELSGLVYTYTVSGDSEPSEEAMLAALGEMLSERP